MRPAILSLLLALVVAPSVATAGPTIEQLRVTLITGDDAMRGSSDALLKLWFDGSPDGHSVSWLTSGIPVDFRALGNKLNSNSSFTTTIPIDPVDIARISNVGIFFDLPHTIIGASTFLFNSPDEWHMDGMIVTGITASGEEYTVYNNPGVNRRFIRLNLYHDDHWRIDEFKSPRLDLTGSDPGRVNEFRVSIRTGDDDLREGSRAFCEVKLHNGWSYEHPITPLPTRLADHTSLQQTFRTPRLIDVDDIASVALRYEADNSGGSTDEWNVQGWSVEASHGLTTREVILGDTPRLPHVLAERFDRVTEFNTSRSEVERLASFIGWAPDPEFTVTIHTGGDDLRSDSMAYLRVLLNDGGFIERRLSYPGDTWGNDSTTTRNLLMPDWLQQRHIRNFCIRYESGRTDGSGDDQWTLNGFSIDYNSTSLTEPAGEIYNLRGSPHHFSESEAWTPDVGASFAPLEEEVTYTYVTEMAMDIPLIGESVYVIENPIPFDEWNQLIWENLPMWKDLLKAAEDRRFEAFAFGLLPGEKPRIEIEQLPDDPGTDGKRFLVRYARLLGIEDATFALLHSPGLRLWNPVPSADISTVITPDPVLRIEWVELTISGPTVAGPRNFFRIEANKLEETTRGGGLIPGEAPSLPPVITPPDGSIGTRW